mmetsp:Transcript_14330/g.36236  ORF Transcript_14330/g.36236 Transcript_14330/m.36236 type:complete len:532 (-) Transcript_14330:167-1762(-)
MGQRRSSPAPVKVFSARPSAPVLFPDTLMTGLSGETVSLRPSAAAGEGHRRPADGSAAETAGEADGACEEGGAGEEDEEAALMGALELEIDPKREQFPPWLFGHPRGLFVLAATEVWERFGFYGMRSLLVLYMTQDLLLPGMKASVWGLSLFDRAGDTSSQMPASRIYGMYTSVAYLTPMLGGLLADRYLGRQRTVMIGAALMSLGYFLLGAWPAAFLPTLMIIAFGSGALKPNVSSQIGLMYDPADARRSAAFLIFYCAINLGAFMSPLVSGVLHATLGFRAGFYASSAAVALGLVQYAAGLRHLPPDRLLRDHRGSDTAEHGPARAPRTFGSLVRHHRARLLAIAAVCVLTVGFWGVYEQQGNTLPVYADQEVEMHLGRTRVPTEFVQSINPLFIIGFTPLLSSLWKRQVRGPLVTLRTCQPPGNAPSAAAALPPHCLLYHALVKRRSSRTGARQPRRAPGHWSFDVCHDAPRAGFMYAGRWGRSTPACQARPSSRCWRPSRQPTASPCCWRAPYCRDCSWRLADAAAQ